MSEIVIYEGAGGTVEVRLEGETVWLNQTQLAALFGRERSVVTKHLGNVFKEGELDEDGNVQNLHVAGSGKRVKFYNLDVVISIGYRVKSMEGTRFRQWATRLLKHLVRGYTLNRQRFEQNARELEAALALVRKAAAGLRGEEERSQISYVWSRFGYNCPLVHVHYMCAYIINEHNLIMYELRRLYFLFSKVCCTLLMYKVNR